MKIELPPSELLPLQPDDEVFIGIARKVPYTNIRESWIKKVKNKKWKKIPY